MSFEAHITKMDERPVPKLWLAKPDFTIIERINGVSNLSAKMNYMNENEISFEVNSHLFDEFTNEQYRNPTIEKMRNKYLIKMTYNNQTEWFIIENFSKTSDDKDYVPTTAKYIGSELDKKWVGDIEEIGVTPSQLFDKFLPAIAPNWSVRNVDEKVAKIKREYTTSDASVSTLIEEVCKATDAVVVFHNRDRQFSFIHRDNAGKFKGLKVKEATYLKGFTDEQNSEDLTTRLVLFGKDGLTINGVNPAGTDYIEDFSFYMKPFRRDSRRNVLEHSDYMSDALCHALLDFEEYFKNKTGDYEKLSEQYTNLLKEELEEEFKLTEITAIKQRLEDRVELLKPQGNYIEKRILGNTSFDFKYNTRYIMVIQNNGTTARLTLNGEEQVIAGGQSGYFKIHTPPQVTNEDPQIRHTLQVLSASPNLMASLSTASEADFAEEDVLEIEKKFNVYKYRELYDYQVRILAAVERRIKEYDNQRQSINDSLAVDTFFPPALVKERENFVNWGIWREENHTDAKALLEDGLKQLKEHNNVERTVTVSLIDFIQSLEDKENWDKLSAGDKIQFSNKIYDSNMEAFISELNINFDNHDVSVTLSNIIDLKDKHRGIAQKMASFVSTAGQVNMQKSQLEDQLHKSNQVIALLEGEWDANKRRITAANETVSIDNRGIIVTSPTHPNEMLVAVAGVIAISNDGGETFKQAINTRGIVAERLIGKVLIGTELVMENNAGTFRFDNEGFRINASNFHLIADDGEDYFDTLMRRLQQEIVTAEEKISEEIKQQGESLKSEINDVDQSLMDYTAGLINALADGLLTEQEIHSLKLQLNMLEADYSQVARRVRPILFDSALDPVVQEELYVSYYRLDDDYQILVSFIRSLEEPTEVPQETINNILDLLKRFKPAIEELVAMIETALTNTQRNRIANAEYNSNTFAENLTNDLNDEVIDLKESLKGLNDSLEDALSDGIITTVEKSQLSDALMRFESEKQDVDNRFHNTYNHAHIVGTTNQVSLQTAKTAYNSAYSSLIAKVKQILNMTSVSHAIVEEYKALYQGFTRAVVAYSEEYERAVEFIQKGYADTAEGEAKKYTDGLRMEVEADVKDIQDNIVDFEADVYGAFKDGIITEQERNRLGIHHDMLEKEKSDLIERYDTIITSDYLQGFYDVEQLVTARSLYGQVHADLLLALELAMMDSKITKEESKEATRLFALYVQRLTQFSKELELAIAALGESKAVAHTNEQLNNYMSLSVFNDEIAMLQAEIDGHIMTWYYNHEPTLSTLPASEWKDDKTRNAHVGDLFYHETEGFAFRFMRKSGGGYEWQLIKDTEVTKALSDAQNALDLADDKRRVFVAQPTPPYDIGDLWIKGDGELMRARVNKEGKTQFSDLDWVKATKYTDDTVANQVGNQLNEYKQSNNQEITDLRETLGAFRQTVEGAFKDGIIAEYELKILKTQMQSLDREKADVDAGYNQLLNHPNLTGAPKTKLQSAYTGFAETHNNLTVAINRVITDGVITESEYEEVMGLLDSYPIALTTYKNVMNEIYLHLIKMAQDVADGALDIAGRLDTWKSSSFEVDSEKIATRVGESSWEEKYLPVVNQNIDNIQVGGVNMANWTDTTEVNRSNLPLVGRTEDLSLVTLQGEKFFQAKVTESLDSTSSMGVYVGRKYSSEGFNSYFHIEKGQEYTLTLRGAHSSTVEPFSYVYIMRDDNLENPDSTTSGNNQGVSRALVDKVNVETGYGSRYKFTFKANWNSRKAYLLIGTNKQAGYPDSTTYWFRFKEVQLEKGNKATDYKLSQRDQDENLSGAIDDFYNTEIKSNYSTTTQTKELLGSYVTSTEMQGNLDKIGSSYQQAISENAQPVQLREVGGSLYNDAFTYEVTIQTDGMEDSLAVGVLSSKGKNKGWDLQILERKGSTGKHPNLYLYNSGKNVAVKPYEDNDTNPTTTFNIIYTKYAGTFSNVNWTKSHIEQTASDITLSVDNKMSQPSRNLIPNTVFPDENDMWARRGHGVIGKSSYYDDYMWIHEITGEPEGTVLGATSPILPLELKAGRNYTLSFKVMQFSNIYDDFRYCYLMNEDGKVNFYISPDLFEKKIIGKEFNGVPIYQYTATVQPDFGGRARVLIATRKSSEKNAMYYIKETQLETGSERTPYKQAPSDVLDAKAELKITADAIRSKVGKGEIISTINQTSEKVQIEADKIELTSGSRLKLAVDSAIRGSSVGKNLIGSTDFWLNYDDFERTHVVSNTDHSLSNSVKSGVGFDFGKGWLLLQQATGGGLLYLWTRRASRNYFTIIKGYTYTFSVLAATNWDNPLNYVHIRGENKDGQVTQTLHNLPDENITRVEIGKLNKRKVYKHTYTFKAEFTSIYGLMIFGLRNTAEAQAGWYLSEWKLEEGEVATPYQEHLSGNNIISQINADDTSMVISSSKLSITADDINIDGKTIQIGSNPAIRTLRDDVSDASGLANQAKDQADAARVPNNVARAINESTVRITGDHINLDGNVTFENTVARATNGNYAYSRTSAYESGTRQISPNTMSDYGMTTISGGRIQTNRMIAKRVDIETSSGRKVIIDGYLNRSQTMTPRMPRFQDSAVTEDGSWYRTSSTSYVTAHEEYYVHVARYLMCAVAVNQWGFSGWVDARMETRSGTFSTYHSSSGEMGSIYGWMRMDLGEPLSIPTSGSVMYTFKSRNGNQSKRMHLGNRFLTDFPENI